MCVSSKDDFRNLLEECHVRAFSSIRHAIGPVQLCALFRRMTPNFRVAYVVAFYDSAMLDDLDVLYFRDNHEGVNARITEAKRDFALETWEP